MSAQPVSSSSQEQDVVLGARYCSYRVGGPIDMPCLPASIDEAVETLEKARLTQQPLTILGGGSNTLIASRGIRGATYISKRLTSVEQKSDRTFLIGAGMPLAKVCKLAQDHALSGVEFMIGVPGTLGGAVTMNAGAMGQDTASVLDHVVIYNYSTGEVSTWTQDQLAFSYRKSAVASHMVVLGAQLTLTPGNKEDIDALVRKSISFRQEHHPKDPNGGSVFKNPLPDKPAGMLLDQAGAKGWRVGGAMVSPMHANFIVNVDNATSTDVLSLMLKMKRTIAERYGLDVHPENRFLGDASEEEKAMWEELTGHAYQPA